MTNRMRFGLWAALCLSASNSRADIAVVVHPSHELNNIKSSQVRNAFLGKHPIAIKGELLTPIDLNQSNPTRDKFYALTARKTPVQMNSYWSSVVFSGVRKKPLSVESADALKRLINRNPSFIGYLDSRHLDSSVKSILLIKER